MRGFCPSHSPSSTGVTCGGVREPVSLTPPTPKGLARPCGHVLPICKRSLQNSTPPLNAPRPGEVCSAANPCCTPHPLAMWNSLIAHCNEQNTRIPPERLRIFEVSPVQIPMVLNYTILIRMNYVRL
jgi:hypothetical protein